MAVFALHPIQYQAPIFRQIALTKAFDLTVLYGDDVGVRDFFQEEFSKSIIWDIPLLEGYNYKFFKNIRVFQKINFFSRMNFGLFSEILFGEYDVVLIHGYETFSSWIVLAAAKISKKIVVFRGESIPKIDRKKNFRSKCKDIAASTFLKFSDSIMYSCSGNRARWEELGVPTEKQFFMPCAVDNNYFQTKKNQVSIRKDAIKAKLGISQETFVVLFPARFTNRKRPCDLVSALAKVKNTSVCALFVGDGPERKKIEQDAKSNNVHVVFTGFVNQSELPDYYLISDLLAVISEYDASPKSINEGLNFGLPVIVSNRVGTANDLVEHDKNGFIVNVGDIEAIAIHIENLANDKKKWKQMSVRSENLVKTWNFDENVYALQRAVKRNI